MTASHIISNQKDIHKTLISPVIMVEVILIIVGLTLGLALYFSNEKLTNIQKELQVLRNQNAELRENIKIKNNVYEETLTNLYQQVEQMLVENNEDPNLILKPIHPLPPTEENAHKFFAMVDAQLASAPGRPEWKQMSRKKAGYIAIQAGIDPLLVNQWMAHGSAGILPLYQARTARMGVTQRGLGEGREKKTNKTDQKMYKIMAYVSGQLGSVPGLPAWKRGTREKVGAMLVKAGANPVTVFPWMAKGSAGIAEAVEKKK